MHGMECKFGVDNSLFTSIEQGCERNTCNLNCTLHLHLLQRCKEAICTLTVATGLHNKPSVQMVPVINLPE